MNADHQVAVSPPQLPDQPRRAEGPAGTPPASRLAEVRLDHVSDGDGNQVEKATRDANPDWYPELLETIAKRVGTGQAKALAAANTEMLLTNWSIGADILARQSRQGWGAKIIDRLAADLSKQYPGLRGFSPRNLRYMRTFAAAWPGQEFLQAGLAQLPWYHHITLLEKVPTPELRRWYAEKAIENGWSRPVLVHHISTSLADRTGKAITNFRAALPPADSDLAQEATKDPYLLDFLGTADLRRERDLEQALVDHVRGFLLELGQGFAFVGRQVRLTVGGDEFFCDLLFYHLQLRAFVVIELKTGDFEPGYLGQLGMYMAAVDDLMSHPDDKPTIGLLLCQSKNNVVAEYALRGYASPMGVAEWTTQLTRSLPSELSSNLPTVAELEAELAAGN